MSQQSGAAVDPLTWWQDKQVAVAVDGHVVRGWVLSATSYPLWEGVGPVGRMTIVLLIVSKPIARQFPPEVTREVHPGPPHGKPDGVLALWDEANRADVLTQHPARRRPGDGSTVAPAVKAPRT